MFFYHIINPYCVSKVSVSKILSCFPNATSGKAQGTSQGTLRSVALSILDIFLCHTLVLCSAFEEVRQHIDRCVQTTLLTVSKLLLDDSIQPWHLCHTFTYMSHGLSRFLPSFLLTPKQNRIKNKYGRNPRRRVQLSFSSRFSSGMVQWVAVPICKQPPWVYPSHGNSIFFFFFF